MSQCTDHPMNVYKSFTLIKLNEIYKSGYLYTIRPCHFLVHQKVIALVLGMLYSNSVYAIPNAWFLILFFAIFQLSLMAMEQMGR